MEFKANLFSKWKMISMKKCGAFIERFAYESYARIQNFAAKSQSFPFFFSLVFILFDEQRVFQITIEQIFSNKSQKNNREMVEIQTEWITMRLAWCKYLEWHSACYEKRINRRRGVWGAWNQYTFILLLPRMFLYSNAIHKHTHGWRWQKNRLRLDACAW